MLKPKDTDQNAKDTRWKLPVDLPGVQPEDYPDRGDQSGTQGFMPQLAGQGKASHSNTSGIDVGAAHNQTKISESKK